MSLQPDQKYTVKVVDAFITESSKKGTMGLCFTFMCDEGRIECIRWVTEATSDRVKMDLHTLGFTSDMLEDPTSLDRLKEITLGNEVEIVTEEKEYNEKITVVVKWINAVGGWAGRGAGPGVRDRMHALLTGKPAPMVSAPRQRTPPAAPTLNDDDGAPF